MTEKVPVSDLSASAHWYRLAFGAERDPVTFGVADEQALDAWIEHFDRHRIEHTDKIGGFIGQIVGITTPDGLDIRLYTDPVGGFRHAQLDPEHADIHNPEISTAKMSSFPDGRN
jgi:hypothetical protein